MPNMASFPPMPADLWGGGILDPRMQFGNMRPPRAPMAPGIVPQAGLAPLANAQMAQFPSASAGDPMQQFGSYGQSQGGEQSMSEIAERAGDAPDAGFRPIGEGGLMDRARGFIDNVQSGPISEKIGANRNALLAMGAGLATPSAGPMGPNMGAFASNLQQGIQLDEQAARQREFEAALAGLNLPEPIASLASAYPEMAIDYWMQQNATPQGVGYREEIRNGVVGQVDPDGKWTPYPEWMQVDTGSEREWELMTGEEIAALNEQGIALDPNRVYKINLRDGNVQTVGGEATGLRFTENPDGSFTFEQGPGVTGGVNTEQGRRANSLYQSSVADWDVVQEFFPDLTNLGNQALEALPWNAGNFFQSEGYQRALNATMNILQNYLVVTSGATVTEEEAERRARQVLPRPGDQPGTIEDKLRRIRDWMTAMQVQAGVEPSQLTENSQGTPAAQPQQQGGQPAPADLSSQLDATAPNAEIGTRVRDNETGKTYERRANGWVEVQ